MARPSPPPVCLDTGRNRNNHILAGRARESCFSFPSTSENSGALNVQQKFSPSLFLSPRLLVGCGLWTIVTLVSSCCLPKRLTPGGGSLLPGL